MFFVFPFSKWHPVILSTPAIRCRSSYVEAVRCKSAGVCRHLYTSGNINMYLLTCVFCCICAKMCRVCIQSYLLIIYKPQWKKHIKVAHVPSTMKSSIKRWFLRKLPRRRKQTQRCVGTLRHRGACGGFDACEGIRKGTESKRAPRMFYVLTGES